MTLEGKKVLVTGGAGFLGTRLCERVKNLGGKLYVPRSKVTDLVKPDDAWKLFDTCAPDVVIHAAAKCGGIGANQENPGKFFYDNMMMGLNVIHFSNLFKVEKVVIIGTICAYPKMTTVPFKETDLWNGYPEETNAPYGIAKKALLVMSQAYRKQYNLNSIYLLPVNLYGPGDNFEKDSSHVIPALIRKFIEAKVKGDKEVVCWGTGKPTREFLYVEDAADGVIAATLKYNDPEPMNIGAGFEISIKDLSNKVAKMTGYKGAIRWDTTKPDGQPRRCLDTSKAERECGWKASTSFDAGLQRTVDWFWRSKGGEA